MQQVVDGEVRVPPIHHWPLEDIDQAIGALREKTVPGKAVIDVAG
jgi:hypothetical protein